MKNKDPIGRSDPSARGGHTEFAPLVDSKRKSRAHRPDEVYTFIPDPPKASSGDDVAVGRAVEESKEDPF